MWTSIKITLHIFLTHFFFLEHRNDKSNMNIGLITRWVIAAAESFLLCNLVHIFRLKLDSQFNGKEIFQSFIQSWWNIALKCFQWFKQKRKLEEEQEGCENVFFLFSIKYILLFCFWQIMIVLENEITKSGPK